MFQGARLSTRGASDLQHNKYVGRVSTIMRLLTTKDSDLSSCFDKSCDSALNGNNVLERKLNNNHIDDKKGRYRGRLELEQSFGFRKTFKKKLKNLGFHPTFKTNNPQDFLLTTTATDIHVTINNLYIYIYIYVPMLIPNTQTQVMFNESIINNYTTTFDSWYTDRKV